MPGIPQVYYVGLLAGGNDMDLLRRTGVGRDINRHYYTAAELQRELRRPLVQALLALLRFRNSHPAFGGTTLGHQPSAADAACAALPAQVADDCRSRTRGVTRSPDAISRARETASRNLEGEGIGS